MINFEFPALNDIDKIFDFGRKEFVFFNLERDTGMFLTCQYIVNVNVVGLLFDSVQVDNFIMKVGEAQFPLIFNENDIEDSLKGRRSVC